MRILNTYRLLCISILWVISSSIVISDIPDTKRISYGFSVLPITSLHVADMLPPKPMSICCQKFTEGKGLGLDISVFSTYVMNHEQSLQASFGYRDISATLTANQRILVNQRADSAFVTSTLSTDLSLIYMQLIHNYSPIHRMELSLGFNVGINASKNYSFREELQSDSITFDNGTRFRNVSFGALAGINPRYFGGVIGLSYSIPLFSKRFFIKPSLQYTYGLRPIQFGTNWYAHTVLFGLQWEYKPFGEVERPVIEELPPLIETQHEKPRIEVLSVKNKIHHIQRYVYEYPVLDEITLHIIENCHSNYLSMDDCSDDHGSCLYGSILDTLSKRSHESSDETIRIGYSTKVMNDLNRFTACLKTHLFEISNVQYEPLASDPVSAEVGYVILNEKLTYPFTVIKHDTISTYASVSFTCLRNSNDSIIWGVYDSELDSVIIKGKSISNEEVMIRQLPLTFKKGKVRCIVFHEGKKELIESELTMKDSTVIQMNTVPVETGVLFAFDSDSLSTKYEKQLMRFRGTLKDSDSLIIEAFTDLSGDLEYNKDLAARRANRIAVIFQDNPTEIILSPLKKRNAGLKEYQKAYNRIVTITRKNAIKR